MTRRIFFSHFTRSRSALVLFYVWAVTYLWIYPLKYFITFREFTSTFSFTTFHNVRCLFKCIILLSRIGNNERTRFDAHVKIMLDRKVRVYIKFVWCSCVNISAFTSLHILPVKTPLRRVHPNSGNTRCRCVCGTLYLKRVKSLPSLQTYSGNIFYIMLVVYIQTWFRTRCLSWRTSCKFVHRFNGRVTFLMWHSFRFIQPALLFAQHLCNL